MKGKVEIIVSTTKTGRAKTNMDCFHSRDQWALFLTKTKGKELNSRKINWGHQHERGDVTWKHTSASEN